MIGGYVDKILRVDLSTGELRTEPYPDEWKRQYLGGSGVAARIIYDEVPPEVGPLDPGNVLCFFTGPYTGTAAPMSGRCGLAAKSPLTGGWGEASVSGFWAPELKKAGFDGIVVVGKSDHPVYLWLHDGTAELLSADGIWGNTTDRTEQLLKEKHGAKVRVASIGPAGEKLVKFASIIADEGRAAGRCGLGAVMGSKGLKAVAVLGSMKAPIAEPDELKDLGKKYASMIKKSIGGAFMSTGTAGTLLGSYAVEDYPVKNWQLCKFDEGAARLDYSGEFGEKIFVRRWACYRCPIACGAIVKVDRDIAGLGPFEGHGPEYETLGTFGGLLMNGDVETVAACNHICNTYGMDTINAGGAVGFLYEAYEKGLVSKDDIGFEVNWGDGEAAVKLTRMIAERDGIGHLLGEGPIVAAATIGHGAEEFAIHVKGMNFPSHDPRVWLGTACEYAVGNRGCCHLQGFSETWESIEDAFAAELGMDPAANRLWDLFPGHLHENEGKGAFVAKIMAIHNTFDALPICKFMPVMEMTSGHEIANLASAITGLDLNRDELKRIGDRLVQLKRAFNIRCGRSRADDTLPKRILTPAPDSDGWQSPIDLEIQLKEFYEEMGWDWETGKPSRESLVDVGLEDVAADLWGRADAGLVPA